MAPLLEPAPPDPEPEPELELAPELAPELEPPMSLKPPLFVLPHPPLDDRRRMTAPTAVRATKASLARTISYLQRRQSG
jgi:hypothetical protein